MARLELIGGGRMGEALLGGLLDAGWCRPSEVRVVEAAPQRRVELAERFPEVEVADAAAGAEGVVLAVKPHDAVAVCKDIAPGEVERVLSVAAGVTLARLESSLPPDLPVVRAMPNTPALVGVGASAIAGGSAAGERDLAWAEEVLSSVGLVVRVPEQQLDAVTGLSGSGPAYLFLVAEAMIEAGVLQGLPRQVAEALVHQTLLGAATLLSSSEEGAGALRAAVTSPGGTTAAGLRELERAGVRAALLEAVAAAARRSAELGHE